MSGKLRGRKPTPALIVAMLALSVALGGVSYAALELDKKSVGTKQLKNSAVTGKKVKDRSLKAKDFAEGQLKEGPQGPQGPQGIQGPPGDDAALPALEAWKPLPLDADWVSYDVTVTQPASYRKDQLGQVHLKGLVANVTGTPSSQEAIATLPAGYRPARKSIFAVATSEGIGFGRVDVLPDGTVAWLAGNTGEPDSTSLDGISFWTD